MGSYQIHISCYSKERTGRWRAKQQWGNLGQLHTFQAISNIRETAKTEHQKTSITTLTNLDSIVSPSTQLPDLNLLCSSSSWIPVLQLNSTLCSLCLHSSACLEQTQSLPLLTSSSCPPVPSESHFLSNHLISQAHSPSYSSLDFLNLFPSVKPQHFSCISSGHDLVSLENGSNCKNFW